MFKDFETDLVTLVKKDGTTIEDIKANVQPKKIFIHDVTIPLEEDDRLIRLLPNGLIESYIVLDRGYYGDFHSIKAHYQASVRKETSPPKEISQNINNHFYGHNSRINVNSQDHSTNIINTLNESNIFKELQKVIQENIIDTNEKHNLIQIVNEMEIEKGNSTFIDKYKNFMTLAANHMTVFSPFIPILSQFLV